MNENEIQVWNYESSEIRTIQKDGEPWFVLSDVCKVLELSSPHKTMSGIRFRSPILLEDIKTLLSLTNPVYTL